MRKIRYRQWTQKVRQLYLKYKKNKCEYLLLFLLILSANFLIGWSTHEVFRSSEFYLSDWRYQFWASEADFSKSEVSMVFFEYKQNSGEPKQEQIYTQLVKFLRKLIALSLEEKPRALVFDISTDKLQLEKSNQKRASSLDEELIRLLHIFNSQISPVTLGYGTDTPTHTWLKILQEQSQEDLPQLGYTHGLNYQNSSKIRLLYLRHPDRISLSAVTLEAVARRENKKWQKKIEQLPTKWREVWQGKKPFPIRPFLPPTGERFFLPVIQANEFLENKSSDPFLSKIHNKVLVIAVDDPRAGDKIQLIHQDNLELLPGGVVHGLVIDNWLKILESKAELLPLPNNFSWYQVVIAVTIVAFLLGFLPHNAFSFLVILLVVLVFLFGASFFLAQTSIAWELPILAPAVYFLLGYSSVSANKKWKLHQVSPVAIAITAANKTAMSQKELDYIKKIAKLYGGNTHETSLQIIVDFPVGFSGYCVELAALEVAAEIQRQFPKLKIGIGREKSLKAIRTQQNETNFLNLRLFFKTIFTPSQNSFHVIDRSEKVRKLAEKAPEGKVLVSLKIVGYVPPFLLEEEYIAEGNSYERFYGICDLSLLSLKGSS